jgi:hypothetical protein
MKKHDEEFVLTWTFTSTVRGEVSDPVAIHADSLTSATLAFHAERQLIRGLSRDDYKIVGIATNHTPPQRYDRYDLPPRNPDIRQCTFTKRLYKQYSERLTQLGMEVTVA